MIWVSSQLIIGYYFERYRPIANGLSCSGAGAGIALLGFIDSMILVHYSWRQTLRLHAVLLLVALLLSFGYVKVPPKQIGIIEKVCPSGGALPFEDRL